MKTFNLILGICLLTALFSCSDDEQPDIPRGAYEKGYFITNEGPFQNGTGTISFVGEDGTVSHQVYNKVNGEDLGNIVNAMHLEGDRAYIVVNNSNRLVVADRYTMEKIAVLVGEGIQSPRHFVASGQRGYLSNWGDPFDPSDDFVSVFDLATNELIEKIAVGEGPERMLLEGNELFVLLQGGYGQNNKVVVIDTSQNSLKSEIEVADVPNSIVSDGSGSLWILCGGTPAWTGQETKGALVELEIADGSTNTVEFADGQHPSLLNFDSDRLYYYLDGKVHSEVIFGSIAQAVPVEGIEGNFYSMRISNGALYTTDPMDYASEGQVRVFDLSSGALLETIEAGIVPGGVVFD